MQSTRHFVRATALAGLALGWVGCAEPVVDTGTSPSCTDGIHNGDETALDCGGTCGATCDNGMACGGDDDCVSGWCEPVSGQCETQVETVSVPFTVVEGVTLSEWSGWDDERSVLRTAADFVSALGVMPPEEIDFDTQWALFHSAGKRAVPGHRTTVDTLLLQTPALVLTANTTLHSPDSSCETFDYAVPAWSLVRFDQIPGLDDAVAEDRTPQALDCTSGATEFSTCGDTVLCGTGLLCAGITHWTSGMCMDVGDWGVFTEEQGTSIPDDGTTVLARTITASGLATVDVDVIVSVELTHPDASELQITLTNPSGNEVGVWSHEAAPAGTLMIERVPVGFSGDETVNGTWTLAILDGTAGNQGSLTGWSVEVMSRWD